LKDPTIVHEKTEGLKLRIDRDNNNAASDDEPDVPDGSVFKAPSLSPRDHSTSLLRLPPKTPGAPQIRMERLYFSDDETDEEEDDDDDDDGTISTKSTTTSASSSHFSVERPSMDTSVDTTSHADSISAPSLNIDIPEEDEEVSVVSGLSRD
jgi:hypothetical protein